MADKDIAEAVFSNYYERLPNEHEHKDNVVGILRMREMGASGVYHDKASRKKHSSSYRKNQVYYSRSLSAAKFVSSAWPLLHPVSRVGNIDENGGNLHQPRQFEYHPFVSSLMAFGTLDGEVIVVNHENGNVLHHLPSSGETSVLGLCWFNTSSSKLLAGFDDGSLTLFDVDQVQPKVDGSHHSLSNAKFDKFEQLTSVHINSTDDQFLTTSYSKKVAIYDIGSGKRSSLFTHMHRDAINVAKFANHSPNLFVTSSFDRDVKMWDLRQKVTNPCYTASSSTGNVMVCFSPDDHYLLASAVDNEVKQLLAVDGRVHLDFNIAPAGNAYNYTRSYYMNGRDYIISGSSDEPMVRICCAQTGRQLKNICLEDWNSGSSIFVQSLRSDPFRQFHLAVLATYVRPSSKREIIKVNLLSSSDHKNEHSKCRRCEWEG
ncbi:hypothetical protein Leryth_002557 [Lithospermum erythrorhizon]|nr:hypothetical protein Leryth_002557 [Lithospermum erythrorhizon]